MHDLGRLGNWREAEPERLREAQHRDVLVEDVAVDSRERARARPTLYAPEAYDCAKVFLDALAAKKFTRPAISAFVAAYDKKGVTKQIKFSADGEVAGDAVYAYAVKGGKIVGDIAV